MVVVAALAIAALGRQLQQPAAAVVAPLATCHRVHLIHQVLALVSVTALKLAQVQVISF